MLQDCNNTENLLLGSGLQHCGTGVGGIGTAIPGTGTARIAKATPWQHHGNTTAQAVLGAGLQYYSTYGAKINTAALLHICCLDRETFPNR